MLNRNPGKGAYLRPFFDAAHSRLHGAMSIAIQKASKAALESSASPLQDRTLSYSRSSCFVGTRAVGATGDLLANYKDHDF